MGPIFFLVNPLARRKAQAVSLRGAFRKRGFMIVRVRFGSAVRYQGSGTHRRCFGYWQHGAARD